MANLEPLLAAASVTASVKNITGDLTSAAKAGGYGAFVQSISGTTPQVRDLGNGRALIVHTEVQKVQMQKWLDEQLHATFFSVGEPPMVSYDIGPIFKPWAIKYATPLLVGTFVLGFMASKYWIK